MASTVHTRLRDLMAPATDDVTMPVDFSRRRWAISRPALAAIGSISLILVLVAAIAGARVPSVDPAIVPTGTVSSPVEPPAVVAQNADSAGTITGSIVVSVVGLVNKPGVVTLRAGARVAEAVEAAGGFTPEANPGSVNLARPLADGEQISVTDQIDPAANSGGQGPNAAGTQGRAGGSGAGSGSTNPNGAKGAGNQSGSSGKPAATGTEAVNINTATITELETLPGVGPATAEAIASFRQENGPFTSVAQLAEVPGIGPKKLEKLSGQVTI